ncbi:MAG: energy-coupling factor ABC transporter permease [Phycisphaerae bacterium]|jgi:cobalt/nickel transport system permease protein|nr:energy-coupling factor ABC transporter permease [Phycisphaerae bacterium]
MHMADALLSPAVGGTMGAVSAALLAGSCRKIRAEFQETKIPLMGVAGAFVFAAQMINFTIPATGSSGHIVGGLLLAILLGPWAGFVVMASILVVQALFFADGGLLALGCNIFNMGFWTCFVAYPLIYQPLAGRTPSRKRVFRASLLAAVAGIELGAFSVVLETVFSGISEMPFGMFLLAMLPIHLAVGIVEGLATAAVIMFVLQHKPEVLLAQETTVSQQPIRKTAVVLLTAALLLGGVASWFASTHPDGLEWSMFRVSGKEALEPPEKAVHTTLSQIQDKTALLPDYTFKNTAETESSSRSWPSVNIGTSISGILGGLLVLALAIGAGAAAKFVCRKKSDIIRS